MKPPLTLAALLFCASAFGQAFTVNDPAWMGQQQSAASAPAPTYLINQGFEGTGYDNSESWTEGASGTMDEDYTAIALVGSQSLYMSNTTYSGNSAISPTFTALNTVYGYAQVRPMRLAASGSQLPIIFCRKDANVRGSIQIEPDGKLSINGNVSGSVTTSAAMSAGTTYHVWWSIAYGSTPESVTVGFSTDGTRPTGGSTYASGTVEITDGAQCNIIVLSNGGGGNPGPTTIFDRVLIDDAQIGDNP